MQGELIKDIIKNIDDSELNEINLELAKYHLINDDIEQTLNYLECLKKEDLNTKILKILLYLENNDKASADKVIQHIDIQSNSIISWIKNQIDGKEDIINSINKIYKKASYFVNSIKNVNQ